MTDEKRIKEPRHFMEIFDKLMKETLEKDLNEIKEGKWRVCEWLYYALFLIFIKIK